MYNITLTITMCITRPLGSIMSLRKSLWLPLCFFGSQRTISNLRERYCFPDLRLLDIKETLKTKDSTQCTRPSNRMVCCEMDHNTPAAGKCWQAFFNPTSARPNKASIAHKNCHSVSDLLTSSTAVTTTG